MCRYTEQDLPEGTRIRVQYLSYLRPPPFKGATAHGIPRWRTTARLLSKETNKVLATATAECSWKDQPSKKIGRAIAIGRALKQYATC